MSSSLSLSLSCSANRTDKGRPACVGAAIRSNSKLPDELRGLGYDVTEIGAGERILPTAIEQWFVTGLDGELKPLTSGSTRPVAQTVTLLLNGDPKHDGHVIRDFCDTFCVPPKLILREMLSRGSFPMFFGTASMPRLRPPRLSREETATVWGLLHSHIRNHGGSVVSTPNTLSVRFQCQTPCQ
jgi:hypothetical protein